MEPAVTLAMHPEEGEVLSGRVVPAVDVPPAREAPAAPARPGAPRLLWEHHGPAVAPFLALAAVWADGAAASAVTLPAKLTLTLGAFAAAWKWRRWGAREDRAHVVVTRPAALCWVLAAAFL
ncbi:MAG TPA: hypothetical protein VFQ68_46075, partial [Streptosporangiaceae bacterium]|nr:hypothetical protein [Streptosporangiaceae bacterium]